MPAGYSGTPLVRKLGVKGGMAVRLLDAPDGYWSLLGGTPEALGVTVMAPGAGAPVDDDGVPEATGAAPDSPADFTHLFATDLAALESHFAAARRGMATDGMVWASWPKKSSGVASEVGRAEVMRVGKASGLVDIKVAAVDETWSGLKFVIPVAER